MTLSIIRNSDSLKLVHSSREYNTTNTLQVVYKKLEKPVIKLNFAY